MAYADELTGPWTMYEPGTLRIEDSHFPATCPPCSSPTGEPYAHIASPDVHVDEQGRRIVMYVHGRDVGRQVTRAAVSSDGIHFEGRPEILGRPLLPRLRARGMDLRARDARLTSSRSRDGLSGFEEGPSLFGPDMRHSALLKRGETLYVFFHPAP